MDIYRFRRDIPAHWPEELKRWVIRCVLSGVVPTPTNSGGDLLPELPLEKALDFWYPLSRVAVGEEDDLAKAHVISASPWEARIIIAWPDGSVHIGVPPRTQEDIAALYRHARIVLEHAHAGFPPVARDDDEFDAALH